MPNALNTTEKEIPGGKYISCMYWYAKGRSPSTISSCTTAQKDTLYKLLVEMTNKDRVYRKLQRGNIVETYVGGVNHRIDSQTSVNLSDPMPMLNIQYQIGNFTHAGVQIYMKPSVTPQEFKDLIIDDSLPYGFTPGQVNGFIQEALKHSSNNQCDCGVEWFIMKNDKDKEKVKKNVFAAK